LKRPTTSQSAPRHAILTAAAWALVIFGTSCTVIFQDAFFVFVDRFLPSDAARTDFARLWIAAGIFVIKGYHMAEFGLLYVLLRHGAIASGIESRRATLVAIVLAVAWAALDEWHQTFVPGRGGTVRDVCIDVAGIAIAAAFVRWRAVSAVTG
jgi:hypothetical protein